MSVTIYFGKVNLLSSDIYDVYSGKSELRQILEVVLGCFRDGMTYIEERPIYIEGEEVKIDEIKYTVSLKEKTDEYIRGYIYKQSKLYYKKMDNGSDELKSKFVENTESIEFYFDVFNEIIGYYTSVRFGNKKFLEIFTQILNKCMEENNKEYRFLVDRYSEGMDLKQIKSELKKIQGIQRLVFTFKPVNPDEDILRSIRDNGIDELKRYENANLSTKSIILTSTSTLGLNINSEIINESLNEIDNLQKDVSAKMALSKGYAKVEAIGKNGVKYSTEDHKPVTRKIRRVEEFAQACKDFISICKSGNIIE